MHDNPWVLLAPHALVAGLFIAGVAPIFDEYGRRRSQIAAHGLLGLLLFFIPTIFMRPTITGEFNALHGFLQSFCSAVHVGHCYLLIKCLDFGRPEQSIVFARIVTSCVAFLTRIFAAWHLSEKSTRGLLITDNFLYCALLCDGVWFLTDIYRFYKNSRTEQEEVDSMVTRTTLWLEGKGLFYLENALYFDAGITLVYALVHYAFPQHILRLIIKPEHTLDSHHYMWCRLFGVLNLMPALISLAARNFPPHLQVSYLASRLATQSTVFILNIWGHWILGVYSANHITGFMISGFFSSFLFSVYHRIQKYYSDETPNRRSVSAILETRTTAEARETRSAHEAKFAKKAI